MDKKYKIIIDDIIKWATKYRGPKFHALFCDPPYDLSTIKKRFGKKNAAPAKYGKDGVFQRSSKGFMGKEWDSDIAFYPETWEAVGEHLLPGAFGMAFGGSRTFHRLAAAIEDAGFIIHPTISWIFGSGFPKATNISKQIDKKAGKKGDVIGKYQPPGMDKPWNLKNAKDDRIVDVFSSSRNNLDIIAPATELSEAWYGHRYGLQALKPAAEFIIVFQKPYDGKPLENIIETGAGAINIDDSRIGINPNIDDPRLGGKGSWKTDRAAKNVYDGGYAGDDIKSSKQGRWPANFVLTHHADCVLLGQREVDGYVINRFIDGAKPFGGGAGHEYITDEQGNELINVWACVDGCPVDALNKQSGKLKSGKMSENHERHTDGSPHGIYGKFDADAPLQETYGDEGGASRFFHQSDWFYEVEDAIIDSLPFYYCAKSNKKERNLGLNEDDFVKEWEHSIFDTCKKCGGRIFQNETRNDACLCNDPERQGRIVKGNSHPTVKPLSICKYLSTLLLPPSAYAPRRILVPFSGSGSEMIGAALAGWDYIEGVELEMEYGEMADARLEWWLYAMQELNETDVMYILKKSGSLQK